MAQVEGSMGGRVRLAFHANAIIGVERTRQERERQKGSQMQRLRLFAMWGGGG